MLFKYKKALETHVIVLIIFSVFVSMFLTYIVAILYGNQHPDCDKIFVEITEKSRNKQIIRFTLEARADTAYILKEYPELEVFKIPKSGVKKASIKKKGSTVTIIPVVVINSKVYECREKTLKMSLKTLI